MTDIKWIGEKAAHRTTDDNAENGAQNIMSNGEDEDANLFPKRVGERLRDARVAAKLDLADIANRTRVPQRQLEALEASDYAALPSITYSVGFAKAYARAVGLAEADISRALRAEMDEAGTGGPRRTELQPYEPADPARVPTRLLAWTAAAIALLIVIGYGVWRADLLTGGASPSEADRAVEAVIAANQDAPAPVAAAAPVAPADGAVVLTAVDAVWLRISDADGKRLFEKEMAAGDRFEVPADARDPRILTGRPQSVSITVGGVQMPPLGDPDKTVKDLGISAAAFAARAAGATATPPAAAAPAPGASPTPRASSSPARSPALSPARPPAQPPATSSDPARPSPAPASGDSAPAPAGQP